MNIFELPAMPGGLEVSYPRPGGDEREIETMLIYDPVSRRGYKGEHTVPYRIHTVRVGLFRWKQYRIIDEQGLRDHRERTFLCAHRELGHVDIASGGIA